MSYIDPLSLVDWTVGVFEGGGAVGRLAGVVVRLQATSDCVDGQFAMVSGNIAGGGSGFGFRAGFQGSTRTFSDMNEFLDPYVFNGDFMSASAGLSAGAGYSFGKTRIGSAETGFSGGLIGGLVAGSGAFFGKSEVTSVGVFPCGCGK